MTNQHLKPLVLVVEENPTVLGVLRFLLEGEGYQVTTAPDSKLARQALDHPPGPIGLIIPCNLPLGRVETEGQGRGTVGGGRRLRGEPLPP